MTTEITPVYNSEPLFLLTVKNNTESQQIIKVLYSMDYRSKNFGLPSGLEVSFTSVGNPTLTYERLLIYLSMSPALFQFCSSSNNRQISFYHQDPFGRAIPIEPMLDINKKNRPITVSYTFPPFIEKWDERVWNIADTQEVTTWTCASFVEIDLKPLELFEIKLNILDRKTKL